MRRLIILFAICFCNALSSQETGGEEALALRRIADFWQEGEYQIAKSQMEEFLTAFPASPYADTLCTALGDLFLREKSYQAALNYYARIQESKTAEQVFLNRMQCLYHLQWYATLADECEAYLKRTGNQHSQATYLLAIALYQQCLNASKDPDTLHQLALRAKPYFEHLSKTDLSEDVSQAFAHLCCILQDYEGASNIYLDLAKGSEHSEELVFQAALLQSKYDKNLALETFAQIAQQGGPHAQDAAYNRLVLFFDQNRFSEIAAAKEDIFHSVPTDRVGLAHLFVGKSFLALKQYRDAAAELSAFLDASGPLESVRPALVHLMDAAFHEGDLSLLESSMDRLKQLNPTDPELPKALFSRAQLLKKEQKIPEAKAQLETLLSEYPDFPMRPQASFELTHLTSAGQEWASCHAHAATFLKEYLSHELAPFAWRYLVRSSYELAAKEPAKEWKEALVRDLEQMLQAGNFLNPTERLDWQFLLAKTDFELQHYEEAIHILEPILTSEASFRERPNAECLLSLCFREGFGDEANFSAWAEKALAHRATLLPPAQQHIALFNAYLPHPKLLDQAAEHLYAAFEEKAEIQLPNLLWLTDYSYNLSETNPLFTQKAIKLLSSLLEKESAPNSLELILLRLGKLYHREGRETESLSFFERLGSQYAASPELAWNHQPETKLCLAEAYLRQDAKEKAETLFEEACEGTSLIHNRFAASALLQSARLKFARLNGIPLTAENPDLVKAAVQLKALVLQKSLENEPLHLEASLDYIDLQMLLEAPADKLAKRLFLLTKTKADFESKEDLLSQDYHAARPQFPEKDHLYRAYMQFIDADIFLAQAGLSTDLEQQKELQAKAKAILLQIASDSLKSPLQERIKDRLNTLRSADDPAA